MSDPEFELSGEEEVVAKPKGHEYTEEEDLKAKAEMTFYGSSKWSEMIANWQKQHPITKKHYTKKELQESDIQIKQLNEEWKKIKAEKEKQLSASRQRLGIEW